jgi:hypothetical protein
MKDEIYIDIHNFKIIGESIKNVNEKYNVSLNIDQYILESPCNNITNNITNNIINNNKKSIVLDKNDCNTIDNMLGSIDILRSNQSGGSIFNYEKMGLFYSTYVTRHVLNNTKIKELYDKEYINIIKLLFNEAITILRKMLNIIVNKYSLKELHYGGLVYNIKSSDKLIIFGDFHGSYHSFFRSLLRLQRQKIIDMTSFKIKDGFKIIFLGDIVDRGNYGLEILSTLVKFFVNNNINSDINNWKILINRGNHECFDIYTRYGFTEELKSKIGIDGGHDTYIYEFLSLLSSAIVIKNGNKKFWLCHGGFYYNDTIDTYIEKITYIDFNRAMHIRWNDFGAHFGKIYGRNYMLSSDQVKNFGADYIIRGHQDSMISASLLANKNYPLDICSDKIIEDMRKKYKLIKYNNFWYLPFIRLNGEYIKCNCDDNNLYDGPIYRLIVCGKDVDINATINNKNYENLEECQNTDNTTKYVISPVLTISTNNDIGRNLPSDSFIIIHNDINYTLHIE